MIPTFKSFRKITRASAVQQVTREHYLRDDIPCGIIACTLCSASINNKAVIQGPEVLVPDTNILLHHLETLTHFQDVILMQTVLDEVRARNSAIYNRTRALLAESSCRWFVFSNEHHKDTYVSAEASKEGESANDRNDRAIRTAAHWYAKHAPGMQVLLLTNDRESARMSQEEDPLVPAQGLLEYVKKRGMTDLIDAVESALAARRTEQSKSSSGKEEARYPSYWSEGQLQEALSKGEILFGVLQCSPYNPNEATVIAGERSIAVRGRSAINRAIQGDSVYLQLQHNSPSKNLNEEASKDDEDDQETPFIGEMEAKPEAAPEPSKPLAEGKVVGIKKRPLKNLIGSIDRKTVKADVAMQSVLFIPMDKRYPRVRFQTRQAQNLASQRIIVQIIGWDQNSAYPTGQYIQALGEAGNKQTETAAILLQHDIQHADFTPAVMACLPSATWSFDEEQLTKEHRADFRNFCVVSVDPPGCTDIDDALHARLIAPDVVEVGVHIADVTHFVQPGSPLDREAAARATTVYLVDRRIDMLPGLLGTNLCSLRGGETRLSFSVTWRMRLSDATILETSFTKSVIKSRAAMTYDVAQALLDVPEAPQGVDSEVHRSLHLLNCLAAKLKERRMQAGALTLASPEFRFQLDTESLNPVDVELKEAKAANSMVEEFMLLANCSVAARIHEAFPESAMLRRHPAPLPDAFAALNTAIEPFGHCLDATSSSALAKSLDAAVLPHDPFYNRLIRIMTTRCMLQAEYFAPKGLAREAFWHYGLATPIYTHFTSPIRRYADVVVHRQLCAAIAKNHQNNNEDPAKNSFNLENSKIIQELAENINYRHRMAQYAQRSSVQLFTHLYFRGKGDIRESAYVIKTMSDGFVALIPQYGIEGLVKVSDDERFTFDSSRSVFVDKKEGSMVVIRLFQKITVNIRVEEVEASQREKLIVTCLDPPISCSVSIKEPPKKIANNKN